MATAATQELEIEFALEQIVSRPVHAGTAACSFCGMPVGDVDCNDP
jgi:hypothetical protein